MTQDMTPHTLQHMRRCMTSNVTQRGTHGMTQRVAERMTS